MSYWTLKAAVIKTGLKTTYWDKESKSCKLRDKVRALEVYRNKDSVEKCFDDLKNDLDMKRIRMHSAATMEGRIFIQFISLLITTRLKQVMNEAGWFKDYGLSLCKLADRI